MPGYLLDNNHVSAIFSEQAAVIDRLRGLAPETQIRTSSIVLGEIDAGLAMTEAGCTNRSRRNDYIKFVNERFLANVCDVTASTRPFYAAIIGRLWQEHPTRTKKQKTERHLVADLGIDINDVWIAATALEHGLTLVTHDGMEKIRNTVKKLGLNIEDWL